MPYFLKRKFWSIGEIGSLFMAGKITHIEVLAQTVKHLGHGTPDQRKMAGLLMDPHFKNYGNLGAVLPDLFYFYHFLSPLRSKKAQFWGDLLHHKNPFPLALHFLDQLKEIDDTVTHNKLFSFTLGFICHCIVDIVTHPYIFYISGDYYNRDPRIASAAQINHLRVEFALDSYLLEFRWGMHPHSYDFNPYIEIRNPSRKDRMDSVVWFFFQNALKSTYPEEFERYYIGSEKKIIPGDLINDSYLGFLEFHSLLDSRSSIKRGILRVFDLLTLNQFKSSVLVLPVKQEIDVRIWNEEKRPWFYPAMPSRMSRETFIELVNRAALESIEAMTKANEYLGGGLKRESFLNDYDGYNLDTGMKYKGVQTMKEFSPL